jgi:hypothetical protein
VIGGAGLRQCDAKKTSGVIRQNAATAATARRRER